VKNKWMIVPYSLTHFLVDFACALFMFHYAMASPDGIFFVLIYNFCAFALQMPFGLFVDYWNRNAVVAAIGCFFISMAFLLSSFLGCAVFLIGIGNALFHVGAGTDVLNSSTEKSALLGVFVSPGAFGIFFGTMYGAKDLLLFRFYPFLMILVGVLILLLDYLPEKNLHSRNVQVSFEGINIRDALIAVLSFFLVVCVRSYLGGLKFIWGTKWYWSYFLICAVVFGKMLGGILSDKLGIERVAVISTALSAVCFFASDYPVLGVIGILCFNMTMPITLWAIAKVFKNARGFSFGLLTLALFLGFLPGYFKAETTFHKPIETGIIAVASLVILWMGLKKVTKNSCKTN